MFRRNMDGMGHRIEGRGIVVATLPHELAVASEVVISPKKSIKNTEKLT